MGLAIQAESQSMELQLLDVRQLAQMVDCNGEPGNQSLSSGLFTRVVVKMMIPFWVSYILGAVLY